MKTSNYQGKTLVAGIAGCGKLAERHACFLRELPYVHLQAVADSNFETAREFARRHNIAKVYSRVEDMLDAAELDVLHVVTPPSFHYECARAAVERGIHVFVEKPVAFTAAEVSDLYQRAGSRQLQLCPDFIQLFHPRMQQLVQRVDSGALGGVRHVETHLCFNLDDSPELRESVGLHWSYSLPGGLLRDYTSHVLYLALYFAGQPQQVQVSRKSLGSLPQGLADHLSVQVNGSSCTASVLLSSAVTVPTYGLRVICEKGTAEVNFDTQSVTVSGAGNLPRRIAAAAGNFVQSWSLSTQAVGNIWNFLRGKLVPYAGLQQLLPRFYAAVLQHGDPPVAPELALAVTQVEQEIFSTPTSLVSHGPYLSSAQSSAQSGKRILVTGGAGYAGHAVTRALVEAGYRVRVLARPTSKLERLRQLGVEVFLGDVRSRQDVAAAARGNHVIVHLAAGVTGTPEFVVAASARGTENVASVASELGLERVLYISSFSVYDYARLESGEEITEASPLEEHPEKRGAYTMGKAAAEHIALANLRGPVPWTIIRPSLMVGGGRDVVAPVGSRIGRVVISLSSPRKYLPLVHVDDVGTAILMLLQHPDTQGEIFTLSSPETPRVRDYVRKCVRPGRQKLHVVYVPYGVARLAAIAANILGRLTGRKLDVNRRRLLSSYRSVRAGSARLLQYTGWQPEGDVLQRSLQEAEPACSEPLGEADRIAAVQD